jgi:hypothetical protein
MTTPAQIDANRRNAILSTGPRSEAGKSTVSRNAVAHGLSSGSPVLASEDQSGFNALVDSLLSEFAPQGGHEAFLIQQMAESRWRLERIRSIETAVYDTMLGNANPESTDARLAAALLGRGGDVLSKLERYAAAAERSYYKAHKELMASAKDRKQQQDAAGTKFNDQALFDLILRPPVYQTKPNQTAAPSQEPVGDDELELLTRPDGAAPMQPVMELLRSAPFAE